MGIHRSLVKGLGNISLFLGITVYTLSIGCRHMTLCCCWSNQGTIGSNFTGATKLQGFCSLGGKTSYSKFPEPRDSGLDFSNRSAICRFIDGTAVEMPVKLKSNTIIVTSNVAGSISRDLASFPLVNRGPGVGIYVHRSLMLSFVLVLNRMHFLWQIFEMTVHLKFHNIEGDIGTLLMRHISEWLHNLQSNS